MLDETYIPVYGMGKARPLLPTQEKRLAREMRHHPDPGVRARAREKMIEGNRRLVTHIAGEFGPSTVLGRDDLIAEGNIGLIDAVDKFDPDRGVQFATYASIRIRGAIIDAIQDKKRPIRLPRRTKQQVAQMRRVQAELEDELGLFPDADQVALVMGIKVKRVLELREAVSSFLSWDAHARGWVDDGHPLTIAEVTAEENPGEAQCEADALLEALENLEGQAKRVIVLGYGLDGGAPLSRKEVAEYLDITLRDVQSARERAMYLLRRDHTLKDQLYEGFRQIEELGG